MTHAITTVEDGGLGTPPGAATLPAAAAHLESPTLAPKALAEIGLQASDVGAVVELAAQLDASDPTAVAGFGRRVAEHDVSYTDDLLAHVRNSDLDEAGRKLGEVVRIARRIRVGGRVQTLQQVPIVGRALAAVASVRPVAALIARLDDHGSRLTSSFETTREQIERLVADVGGTQAGLTARNASMQEMFTRVSEEHRLIGLHVAAGRLRLEGLRQRAGELRAQASTPVRGQEVADLDSTITNLEIRVANLVALQQSCMQTLPQIRVLQATNDTLIDKFHTIKEVTLPALARQFMLAAGLKSQREAVMLAGAIDDTTNELLRENATLLRRNAVEAAKASQRLVIDIGTLQAVQTELVGTVQDVLTINATAKGQRQQAERTIAAMRENLQRVLIGVPAQGSSATAPVEVLQ